ncbi:hypothetical protein AAFP35_05520 [Gordonia sp. CPCC 206044]|uniref:hypothetical protein n=1 Tax=Gordonia sp. CPCC 206044 TaxID=3140793 RepID=UPI003AF39957
MSAPARLTRRGRRRLMVATVLAVVAAVVAILGVVGAQRARPVPDDAQRSAVQAATARAVTALMTFGPDTDVAARDEVAGHLTGPLDVEYRSQGPDLVLPGAVEAGASMTVRVVGVGVNAYSDEQSQVMVFADQVVRIPGISAGGTGNDETAPIARWATMRNVGGNWRLADLETVGGAPL